MVAILMKTFSVLLLKRHNDKTINKSCLPGGANHPEKGVKMKHELLPVGRKSLYIKLVSICRGQVANNPRLIAVAADRVEGVSVFTRVDAFGNLVAYVIDNLLPVGESTIYIDGVRYCLYGCQASGSAVAS